MTFWMVSKHNRSISLGIESLNWGPFIIVHCELHNTSLHAPFHTVLAIAVHDFDSIPNIERDVFEVGVNVATPASPNDLQFPG